MPSFCPWQGGRPAGTKRRQLEWLTNFVLVVASLFGVAVGAALHFFYKLHILGFMHPEYKILPLILLGEVNGQDLATTSKEFDSFHYPFVF